MSDHIQINITVSQSSEIPDYDVYEIRGKRYDNLFIDNFTIYEFNLPKLIKNCYNDFRFIQSLYYDEKELIEKSKGDKDMEKLWKEVERINSDTDFIRLMSVEEEERKYINTIKELGVEQGSLNEKKEIALKLIKRGISIDDIIACTGLTKEEVKALQRE